METDTDPTQVAEEMRGSPRVGKGWGTEEWKGYITLNVSDEVLSQLRNKIDKRLRELYHPSEGTTRRSVISEEDISKDLGEVLKYCLDGGLPDKIGDVGKKSLPLRRIILSMAEGPLYSCGFSRGEGGNERRYVRQPVLCH